MTNRLKIALIGGGVAGVTASYILQRAHHVTLFEKNNYVGGHTNTVTLSDGPDAGTAIDTGFIVLNNKNYPLFNQLLKQLDCAIQPSNMSFGFWSKVSDLQYAGTGLNGLFAQRRNLLRPSFVSMLCEIMAFCRKTRANLHEGRLAGKTMGEYLAAENVSEDAVRQYIIPMGAAIWSAPQSGMFDFPADTLCRFWENHGLLSLEDRPQWMTVSGGSQTYVRAFLKSFTGAVRTNSPVAHVRRDADGIIVRLSNGAEERFERVVIACHADEALTLLADATPDESRWLGAWRYQRNRTVLHTDLSLLPPNRRAWASWNYCEEIGVGSDHPVVVTYHMNRLQSLRTHKQYCVTLNPIQPIASEHIVREFDYTHPLYNFAAVESQQHLPKLNGVRNTYFCGSYFGYGFHEDAVRSGVAVANMFQLNL
jgi:predicted NAD/FAD-binding protein